MCDVIEIRKKIKEEKNTKKFMGSNQFLRIFENCSTSRKREFFIHDELQREQPHTSINSIIDQQLSHKNNLNILLFCALFT